MPTRWQVIWQARWALVPVLLMSGTVVGAAVAVTVAVSERGALAAEPDYYRRGAAYDDWKRQVAANGALRWVVTPEIVPARVGPGARIELSVTDKHGIALEGAAVRAEVVPIVDADARCTVELAELSPGIYGADVPLRIGGQWEIRATVEWKGKTWSDRMRRSVSFRAAPKEQVRP
jgi:nitrogen fixation protein FixH